MIELIDIEKTYNKGKSNSCKALQGVSITVETGEMVALTGTSGSGKSTLLHILGLVDDYETGRYILDGVDVTSLKDHEKARLRNSSIGIVVQDFALLEAQTALQNVMVPLLIGRKSHAKEIAKEKLKEVGLAELFRKKVKNMSGGQKQRVAIARALANTPKFILADEPTGALDSKTTEEIMELFHQINEQGTTVVIVTHDSKVAMECGRVISLSDGKVV